MTSVRREIQLNAAPAGVWDALADFWAVHERVAPGFVTDTKREAGARIVTFSNGNSARELLITSDAKERRLVYAVQSERLIHYTATLEVIAESQATCRLAGPPTSCRMRWRPTSSRGWMRPSRS